MRVSVIAFIVVQLVGISCAFASVQADSAVVQYDSSAIELRLILAEKIEAYRADSDFDYGYGVAEGVSLWNRILYWLARLLQMLFGDSLSGDIFQFIFYVFCLAGLTFIILRLLDVDATRLFYRREKGEGLNFQDSIHDNIHHIDFEEETRKALEEKDFRKAIRLRYLSALKQLADRQLIHWQPGKTNTEYLQEVSTPLQPALYDLNYYYIYTWYGNFPAHEDLYRHVEETFYQMEKKLMAHA